MIPKEKVQEVIDTARVEEVVGEFVHLKKRGVNQIGLCPFHNEKTPSFIVSPAKGIFKCFGCGEAGSSVDFIMKHEHYTFPQAIKWLAQKYHIEIQEEEQSPEQIEAENEREGLFNITNFAAKFFEKTLYETEKGKAIGLSYFNERGFSEQTIKKFQLGYSPETWDGLSKAAIEAGYTKEYLVKAGLAIQKDNGNVFDRFRNRVIFPIHNASGRVLGFGGRILITDKKQAKYVNSPETLIYNKSNVLFGLFTAKNAIIKQDNCLLVEGYTDVISLFQSGIENVVSSSGTSLTTGQIKLIKRYTQNITILYDGDAAGIKASFRGINMIVEEGLNVRVVLFPTGEDPDSFARSHNSEQLETFLKENAQDFIHFKADLLSKEAGDDPVKKAGVVREIIETIALVPEQLNRIYFIRETSELLNVKEEILTNEVIKVRRKQYYKDSNKQEYSPTPSPPPSERQIIKTEEGNVHQEREIVRLLLNYGSMEFNPDDAKILEILEEKQDDEEAISTVADFIIEELEEFDDEKIEFSDVLAQKIYNEFVSAYENETIPSEKFFVNYSEENVRKYSVDLLTQPYMLSPNWLEKHKISISEETNFEVIARACIEAVYSLKSRIIKNKLIKLQQEIQDENSEEGEKINIMLEYRNLLAIKNKIDLSLGRIVVE